MWVFLTLIFNNCAKTRRCCVREKTNKNTVRVWDTSRERTVVEQLSNLYVLKANKYSTGFRGVLPDYRPVKAKLIFIGACFILSHSALLCKWVQSNQWTVPGMVTTFYGEVQSINHSVSQNRHSVYVFHWPNRSQIVHIFTSLKRKQHMEVKRRKCPK